MADYNHWDTKTKAQQLAISLKGEARKAWTTSFPGTPIGTDYELLVAVLNDRFCPKGQEEAYKAEFDSRLRKKNETLRELGYDLRRLATRAYPKMAFDSRDIFVMDKFLQVLDPATSKHVKLKHPSDLSDAINKATEYEAVSKTTGQAPAKPVAPVSQVPTQDVNRLVAAVNQMTDRMGQILNSPQTPASNRNSASAAPNAATGQQGSSWTPRPRSRSFNCFNCGLAGHMARVCTNTQCFLCGTSGHQAKNCQMMPPNHFGPYFTQGQPRTPASVAPVRQFCAQWTGQGNSGGNGATPDPVSTPEPVTTPGNQ